MRRFIPVSIFVVISVLGMLFFSSNKEKEEDVSYDIPEDGYYAPQLPDKAYFCGEEIDLSNYYLRERFDREILSFSYWHSQIFLMIKRANKFFPIIEPILKKEGIPDDFKYLAMIESSLDQRALSGANAAGIWQILPETAKEAGLEVNDDIDERYNLEKSTEVACKFLKRTHDLTNSWSAAAASYNTGRARVLRQIETQQTNNYFDMLFSEETNRYVFRIIIAKCIMENPKKYGFYLKKADLYYMPKQETVAVDSSITNLTEFAISKGCNYQLLKDANPWLRSNSIVNKNKKRYIIKITTKEEAMKRDYHNVNVHNKSWVID
ncbi:MAG: transglycosylase SLT domain-containing protein [Paludibacteraceae bacterium]|nr:transglycosylase SLT domain-containing protein [Paludibacteraceae bacterium]HOU69319.1 transglycosylase SLT domain-containing protein [Paludibacteraceae bacterium]